MQWLCKLQNTTITTKNIIITIIIIIQINYLKNITIMIIINLYTSFNNNTLLIHMYWKCKLLNSIIIITTNYINFIYLFLEVCALFLYLLKLKNPLRLQVNRTLS